MKPHSHTRHAEPLKRVGIIAKARGASPCLLCLRENNARSNPAPRQMPRLFFIGSSSKKNARLFPAITTQAWRHFRINPFSPDSTSEHCSCSMSLLILCGAPPHPYLNINMTPTLFSLCFMFYAKMKHDAFPAHKKNKGYFLRGERPASVLDPRADNDHLLCWHAGIDPHRLRLFQRHLFAQSKTIRVMLDSSRASFGECNDPPTIH